MAEPTTEWSIGITAHGPMSTTLDVDQVLEMLAGRGPAMSLSEPGADAMVTLELRFSVVAEQVDQAVVRGVRIFSVVAPALSIVHLEVETAEHLDKRNEQP